MAASRAASRSRGWTTDNVRGGRAGARLALGAQVADELRCRSKACQAGWGCRRYVVEGSLRTEQAKGDHGECDQGRGIMGSILPSRLLNLCGRELGGGRDDGSCIVGEKHHGFGKREAVGKGLVFIL